MHGASAQTLPLFIFSMIRTGVSPVVNALATVMLSISGILVIAFCSLRVRARVWLFKSFENKRSINVFMCSGVVDPKVLVDFEKESGIKVT